MDFVHDTAFHFSEDSSEDGDEYDEVDGSEDENKRQHQYPRCELDCRARSLPCTVAMLREMERAMHEDQSEPTALPES